MRQPRSRSVLLAGTALLALGACSTGGDSGAPAAPSSAQDAPAAASEKAAASGDKPTHLHTDDHHGGQGAEGSHAAGHGGHADAGALKTMLLTDKDVDDLYVVGTGHGHGGESDKPLQLADACLPIAHLIGEDPSVQQDVHPQARTAFVKSHVGPLLSESIIDYGDAATAAKALTAVEKAAEQCDEYSQAAVASGAHRYQVSATDPAVSVGDAATGVHLDALGADFDKVAWDLTVVQQDQFLVAVGYRTTVGAEPTELRTVVPTAVKKLA